MLDKEKVGTTEPQTQPSGPEINRLVEGERRKLLDEAIRVVRNMSGKILTDEGSEKIIREQLVHGKKNVAGNRKEVETEQKAIRIRLRQIGTKLSVLNRTNDSIKHDVKILGEDLLISSLPRGLSLQTTINSSKPRGRTSSATFSLRLSNGRSPHVRDDDAFRRLETLVLNPDAIRATHKTLVRTSWEGNLSTKEIMGAMDYLINKLKEGALRKNTPKNRKNR